MSRNIDFPVAPGRHDDRYLRYAYIDPQLIRYIAAHLAPDHTALLDMRAWAHEWIAAGDLAAGRVRP